MSMDVLEMMKSAARLWAQEGAIEGRYDLDLSSERGHDQQQLDLIDDALGRLGGLAAPVDTIQLSDTGNAWGLAQRGDIWLSDDPTALDPSQRRPCTSILGEHDEPLTQLQSTLVHEVGHVHDSHDPEVAAAFTVAAGWTDDPTHVPEFAPTGGGEDYALSAPGEYFAEQFTKAVNLPELFHHDFIAGPEAAVAAAAERNDLAALEALSLAAAQKRLQWQIMREDVFGVTDDMVAERAAELEMLYHGDADLDEVLEGFARDAEMAMTPRQLEGLVDHYLESERPHDDLAAVVQENVTTLGRP